MFDVLRSGTNFKGPGIAQGDTAGPEPGEVIESLEKKDFDQWAIVELFGHQRIAGQVSSQQIGGSSFVRVDIPAVGKIKGFTKLLGAGSIYAITITDEETAKAVVLYEQPEPMSRWSIQETLGRKALPGGGQNPDEEDEP